MRAWLPVLLPNPLTLDLAIKFANALAVLLLIMRMMILNSSIMQKVRTMRNIMV